MWVNTYHIRLSLHSDQKSGAISFLKFEYVQIQCILGKWHFKIQALSSLFRLKLKEYYPDVNITMIQKLYGLNLKEDQIASDSRMKIWTKDSKVDSKFRDYLDPKSKEFLSISNFNFFVFSTWRSWKSTRKSQFRFERFFQKNSSDISICQL